jgi:hypothetical protein
MNDTTTLETKSDGGYILLILTIFLLSALIRPPGRERDIRIRQWTYDQLREIGKIGMDFDDVVTKPILEYRKRQKG